MVYLQRLADFIATLNNEEKNGGITLSQAGESRP
ncbi:hypothetical protein JOD18_004173 [Gracilibacillus alcaliphilus]|nr:hypothetical protein [Gracilibacillus alcaliphilus]